MRRGLLIAIRRKIRRKVRIGEHLLVGRRIRNKEVEAGLAMVVVMKKEGKNLGLIPMLINRIGKSNNQLRINLN